MPQSSRKGKHIARKACDLCRERKCQCVPTGDDSTPPVCQGCRKLGLPCTFLTDRKPRGPPSRHVIKARTRVATPSGNSNAGSESAGPVGPVGPLPLGHLPLGQVTIEHLVSEATLRTIIADYLDHVYPILPLIHIPSFTAAFQARLYNTDAAFFRLCVTLCAVTAASIPRRFESYNALQYKDVGQLFDRASHLVLVSRIQAEPEFQNRPTMGTMIVSVLLAMAAHYAGRPNAGWAFASEAVQFFRALQLYKRDAYAGLGVVEAEMCKRAFWVLYIIQVHDRMSFIIPHTGLSYDPKHTDWDFMVPIEAHDEYLSEAAISQELAGSPTGTGPRPVIAGFIALIRLFRAAADVLTIGFPGPPAAYSMTSGPLQLSVGSDVASPGSEVQMHAPSPSLGILLHTMRMLGHALDDLPDELKLPHRRSLSYTTTAQVLSGRDAHHFQIMLANIHVTSLYIQSSVLDACLSSLPRSSSTQPSALSASSPQAANGFVDRPSADSSIRSQLWQIKENLAAELLDVLKFCTPDTLEPHGSSIIIKIREVAATLLDYEGEGRDVLGGIEDRNRHYITQFVDILASLDHTPRIDV